MPMHRTLALATSVAALTAFGAPAMADGLNHSAIGSTAINVTGLGTAGDVTVVRNMDRRSDGANVVAMVITKGDIEAAGGGFRTEIERTDQWEPGALKGDDGDYYMITPQTRTGTADPGKMQVVRSDRWQPGYLKTEQGDYYMLTPDRNRPMPDGDLAVVVDPAWSDAMQVYTLDGGQADRGSDLFIERSDQWRAGYVKDSDGDYTRLVHLRDSVPADMLPDF